MEGVSLLGNLIFIAIRTLVLSVHRAYDTVGRVGDSVARLPRAPKNHAASARPSYALLSFAFTFCGTLPINQSRTPYYT